MLDITERSGVVHREQSKGPNTLPCGTPYFNKLGCDLSLEVTAIWDRPERNEDSKFKVDDENQTSIVSGEEGY